MGQYPGYQPAEVAFEMLQQLPHAAFVSVGSQRPNASTLMPSIENISSTQGARDLLLAYLQEVKSQFLLQKTIDQKVYNDCTTIRNKIEENPAFQMMMNL
tara:strand:- start:78 stop:377 length:300 start_codon:yes stop_codon:yes gene_type:complete